MDTEMGKYWYFRFEGRFEEGAPDYSSMGVFSNCCVPRRNYQKARSMFVRALKQNQIELIEILEHSAVDAEELDPDDSRNTFWIELYEEAKKERKAAFHTYHLYKTDGPE